MCVLARKIKVRKTSTKPEALERFCTESILQLEVCFRQARDKLLTMEEQHHEKDLELLVNSKGHANENAVIFLSGSTSLVATS